MACEDVDDVCGIVVVVRKVNVNVEAVVVVGVYIVNTDNKVVLDNYGVECG